jgi:hypothetical protein
VTVVDAGPFTDSAVAVEQGGSPPASRFVDSSETGALRVVPMIGLEWSQAIDQWGGENATTPAGGRGSWLHRAPEPQVLALYRTVSETDPDVPAPWWLRALAAGLLPSRADGFAVEDRVTKLLSARPGWVYVPWAVPGASGYWEHVPSERRLTAPGVPTTLLLTARHAGWIDVVGVYSGEAPPAPLAVHGLADLRANLARIESLSPTQ